MKKDLEKTVLYPHAIERVWRALTDRAALAAWLMPNDFAPVLGHEFTFTTEPRPGFDGIVHCKVIELEAPRVLAYTWRGGPIDTVVRFRLEREGDGTRMHFAQTGFDGQQAVFVAEILSKGWDEMFATRLPARISQM